MTERDALQLVHDNNGRSFDDMLEIAVAQGHDEMAVKLRFDSLFRQGYITGVFHFGYPVTMHLAGEDRLEQLNQEAIDKTKQEKQQRFENKIAVLTLLVTLVSFIAGLVVEHTTNVVSNVLVLFH